MTVVRIGLDIAKHVFQVHGVAEDNRVLVCRQLRRTQVVAFFLGFRRVSLESKHAQDLTTGRGPSKGLGIEYV